MIKILSFVFLVVSLSAAVTPFSYNWTIRLTGDTATVTKWKANNDSVLAGVSRICDTINTAVLRGSSFQNQDSIKKLRILDSLKVGSSGTFINGLAVIVSGSGHQRATPSAHFAHAYPAGFTCHNTVIVSQQYSPDEATDSLYENFGTASQYYASLSDSVRVFMPSGFFSRYKITLMRYNVLATDPTP